MSEAETDAQRTQGKRLGKCAQHQHVRIASDQTDARTRREIHVGFVHEQQARDGSGQALYVFPGGERARGCIRVAHDGQPRPSAEQGFDGQREIIRVGHTDCFAALQRNECVVQAIGGRCVRHRITRVDARAHDDTQQFVRAITDDDGIGRDAVARARRFAQPQRHGVRIQSQIPVDGLLNGGQHAIGGRIRVLVRVQLDVGSIARLLPWHIAGERRDSRTYEGCAGHLLSGPIKPWRTGCCRAVGFQPRARARRNAQYHASRCHWHQRRARAWRRLRLS